MCKQWDVNGQVPMAMDVQDCITILRNLRFPSEYLTFGSKFHTNVPLLQQIITETRKCVYETLCPQLVSHFQDVKMSKK